MKLPVRVGIMIGSDSDLPQCILGFDFLMPYILYDTVEVVVVITNSIHRHTDFVLANLKHHIHDVDFWIIGAGWANHLTGTADAYLRYTLKNDHIRVVGVAFEDKKDPENTDAAVKSIKKVPGTQVIYPDYFVPGEKGFLQACIYILTHYDSCPPINLKEPPEHKKRSFEMAMVAAREELARQSSKKA